MKKVLKAAVVLSSLSLFSLSYAQEPTIKQYPYLYKSPRAMGMGGAYVAIGGRTDTLFYNPAGLSTMPKKNLEVNILGLSAGVGQNSIDFAKDIKDALDMGDLNGDGDPDDDRLKAVNDVLAKYRGKNLHLDVADWTSVGRNQGKWAFAVGGVASLRIDASSHQGFSSNGILEVNADATGGGVLGFSVKLLGELYAGVGVKVLHRESLIHSFTAREIVEKQDDLKNYIVKDLRKSGNAVGFDAGIIYNIAEDSWLRPRIGVSVMNIGDLKFGDAGSIPMTTNVGVAVNPKIPIFSSLVIGLDYVDVFNNFKEDKDKGKRIRLGGELYVIDNPLLSLGLRAGLYQGYPTFGADLRFLLLTVSYVTYSEEVGAYAGQDKDRRHLLFINVGW